MTNDPDDLTEDIEQTWAHINSRNRMITENTQIEFLLPNGEIRRLGNNEVDESIVSASAPVYGTAPDSPIIPRDRWDELLKAYEDGPDDPHLPYVHDQDGVGQCNCDATTALEESLRMVQGLEFVKLSPADLYDRINGGSDNRSSLPAAMKEMTTRGVGTAATSGLLWHKGMKTASAEERARFMVLEVFLCPTFDHYFSAILSGFKGVSGIRWFNNYTPDSQGWLPQGSGKYGGHAIFSYKPTKRNGIYGLWHQQSWGEKYGPFKGRFVIPEPAYQNNCGGIWVGRAVTDEGGVIPTGK